MNKYLPRDLRNLKDNKQRVMQNVEQSIRGKRAYILPKLIGSFIALAAIVFISLFTYQQFSDNNKTTTDNPNVDVLAPGEYDDLLRKYFPEDQSKKLMFDSANGEFTVETYWLSNNYIKEVKNQSNTVTYTYYLIANNKIDLVKEAVDQADYTIDELNKMDTITTLVEAPFREGHSAGEWVVKEVDATKGMFKNVLVLERNDVGYISTHMLAPRYGHIYSEGSKDGEVGITISFGQLTTALDGDVMRFDKIEDVVIEPTFHTPWQKSPLGQKRLTLIGKGEQGGEEGVGLILIEDTEYDMQTIFSLTNVPYNQITPKNMEWIDEERIFVTIGMAQGMVTVGGDLYILNLKENTLTPVITELNVREEISNIYRIDDTTYTYEKFTYLTDMMDYNESKTETGTIKIASGFVYGVDGDFIEYNLGDKKPNETSKVQLQDNNDSRAITLEELNGDDLIEFILLDDLIVQMNKVDYQP